MRPARIDIYRSANLLIKQHGADAIVFAAMQADACAAEGDTVGRTTWLRVIEVIGGTPEYSTA